jgi:hypothetical protein
MSNLKISFPGGAGGNWLSNLIFSLEHNLEPTQEQVNWHSLDKKSDYVNFSHNVEDKSQMFFNGRAVFNIYLNVVKKLRHHDQQIHLVDITEKFETLASEASSKLFFLEERIDLNWDYIFLDESKFVSQLFDVLDNHNVDYIQNQKICKLAIENYKKTCVDPTPYFDNFDSEEWLGWCNGISKHLWQDWPLVTDLDQLRKFLQPKKEYYRDFTRPYMIDIK